MKPNYRKNDYYMADNDRYIVRKKYEPQETVVRELNPVTETYEYKKVIVNHKLNWENTEKAIQNTFLIVKENNTKE